MSSFRCRVLSAGFGGREGKGSKSRVRDFFYNTNMANIVTLCRYEFW